MPCSQLHKRFKEHPLSLWGDTFARIDHRYLEIGLFLFLIGDSGSQDNDVAFLAVVLYRILDDVKEGKLKVLPVGRHFFSSQVAAHRNEYLQFVRDYLGDERVRHLLDMH